MFGSAASIPRAIEIGVNLLWSTRQLQQFKKTIWKDKVDYWVSQEKDTICMVPGLTCDVWTYERFLREFKNNYNILKLASAPQGYQAIITTMSIKERVNLLLHDLNIAYEQGNITGKLIWVWHSTWVITLTEADRILRSVNDIKIRFYQIFWLSGPVAWSKELGEMLFASWIIKSVADLHPDSQIIQSINDGWRIDHNFITLRDQLLKIREQVFSNIQGQHMLDHGHFAYMLWEDHEITHVSHSIQTLAA